MPFDRSPSGPAYALGALAGLVVLAACTDKAATGTTGAGGTPASASAVAYLDTAIAFEEEVFIPAYRSRVNFPADSSSALDSLNRTHSQGPGHDTLYFGPVEYTVDPFLRKAGDQHSDYFPPSIAPGATNSSPSDPTANLAGFMLGANAGVKTASPVAYLWYPAYDGTNDQGHVDSTQTLIRSLDQNNPCGYVLDLRYNYGGAIFPMLAGLSPLIGNSSVTNSQGGIGGWGVDYLGATYLVYSNNGATGYTTTANTPAAGADTGLAIQASNPYVLKRPNSPVAILIDTVTASAAEFITLSFRGSSVPYRTFGGNSYGVTTTPYGYSYHDGGFLNIAAAIMRDRTGTYYGGSIAPDTPISGSNTYSVFSKLVPALATNNPDAAVQAAVTWLNTQASCGGAATAVAAPSFVRSAAVANASGLTQTKAAVTPPKGRRVSPVWMVSRPQVRRTIAALRRQR